MRYPEFLPENGTLGFAAPAFGCTIEPYRSCFDHALERFAALGYRTILGPNCYASEGIGISSTPEKCGRELTESYCSPESDVLISCGGGELMCEDLDFVDFDRIRSARPKWFMGLSDNTNFTFLLNTLCDTASIYGPCAASFGMEPWDASIQDAWDLLHGRKLTETGYPLWEIESVKDEEHPLAPWNLTEPRVLKTYPEDASGSPIQMEGRLIGGCLDILTLLVGTKFDRVAEFTERYREDGILWFIESCDLTVMSVRRALWQMEHAGWFSHVKGFLVGRPYLYGQEMLGLDMYEAVTGILGKYGVPIIMDADIGHLHPAMPLIGGSYGKVSLKGQDLRIDMELR